MAGRGMGWEGEGWDGKETTTRTMGARDDAGMFLFIRFFNNLLTFIIYK
jgi:hypothetical protein